MNNKKCYHFDKDFISTLAAKGLTSTEIAFCHGCSRTLVSKFCRDNGIVTDQTPPINLEVARVLAEDGHPCLRIAELLRCDVKRLRKQLKGSLPLDHRTRAYRIKTLANRPLTIDGVQELVAQGQNQIEIGREFGVSQYVISQYMIKNGILPMGWSPRKVRRPGMR